MISQSDIDTLLDQPHDEVLIWLRARLPSLPPIIQFPLDIRLTEGRLTLDGTTVIWQGKVAKALKQLDAASQRQAVPPPPLPRRETPIKAPLDVHRDESEELAGSPATQALGVPPDETQLARLDAQEMDRMRTNVALSDEEIARTRLSAADKDLPVEELEARLPGVWAAAKNFGASVKAGAKRALATGRVYAPADVVQARRAICLACKHLTATGQCGDLVRKKPRGDGTYDVEIVEKGCGCFVQAKTALVESSCPVGKWTTWEPPKDELVIVEGM